MPVSLSVAHALCATPPADLHQALETQARSGEQVMHGCNS
jgi:hypothetical protein